MPLDKVDKVFYYLDKVFVYCGYSNLPYGLVKEWRIIMDTYPRDPARPPWRGFHHVALLTRDLDATIRFYQDVLGMEISFTAPAGDLHGRHCGIRPGSEPDRLGLHFFEYLQAPYSNPLDQSLEATVFDPGPTFLSHISFALPNEEAGLALRERLNSSSVPMTPIMDQGDLRNMVFLDNNGMALEAIWPHPASA
jgi:catechol 2,3-dioxygenase-like lactoylglutathione lyase family enzyme